MYTSSALAEQDRADALIYDYPFAAEEIKEHPRTVIVQYNLNRSEYAVGVPEGERIIATVHLGEPAEQPPLRVRYEPSQVTTWVP